MSTTTDIWQEYERGVDYKTRIGLYRTVDLNERFYSGDQWVGVPHEGLPTPVVNFIKYASAWKIAAVTERRLALQFFADGTNDGGDIGIYARQISAYCDTLWERLKMDYLTKEGLKQAAITGDYIQYFYWDPSLDTGQAVTGDIATQLIDNVNYYPGNPNTPDVQSQPYIILAFREMVDKVREEAKRNGCGHIDEIVSDEENEYTSGDRGKVELDGGGKCNVLLKMYRKDGRVWCEKSVRNAVIQPAKDTQLSRYPVALMNWDTRKNCCHGVAEVTGLIPNQVYVNKIMALSQLSQMQMSFPKVVYDRTRIREWTNKVAGAIPVNGDIGGAAQYLTPPGIAYDAWRGLDATINNTMKMMGANDVTLGNLRNPDNTSAFIAARDAAMVPLQSHQERFYGFVEDIGMIWLDFIRRFYKGGRMIPVVDGGKRTFVTLPEDALDEYVMRLKVEAGPSTMWSEIQVLQTLDNLLKGGKLTLKQYLERLPEGHIPMKQDLLSEVEKAEQGGQGAPGEAQKGAPGGGQAAPSGGQGAPGGGQAGALLKLVQAGVQSGDVKKEAAQAIMKLAQSGAGTGEIAQAIKAAAAKGWISQKFIAAMGGGQAAQGAEPQGPQAGMAEAAQTGPQGSAQPTPEDMAAKQPGVPVKSLQGMAQPARTGEGMDQYQGMGASQGMARQPGQPGMAPGMAQPGQAEMNGLMQVLREGAQSGDLPREVAEALARLLQQGASATDIVKALKNAAAQGMVSQGFVEAAEKAAGQPGGGESSPMAQNAGRFGIPAGGAQGVEALKPVLQAGVKSGDVKPEAAQAINALIQSGAGAAEILKAAREAAAQGRVSQKFLAAVEKLLAGQANPADEATDRRRVITNNRNQLNQ